MSENIGGNDLLGSGGHQWNWGGKNIARKSVGSTGILGEYHQVTAIGARPGSIAGKGGQGAALLIGTGENRAASDAALAALEAAIEDLVDSGDESDWEDDAGHSGTALVLTAFRRQGGRLYAADGTQAWQYYVLEILELNGGF